MTPEKYAIKRATAEMIKGVGGLEAAAPFCRVGKSVLGDNQSVNRPDSFIAIDVVQDLEPLARDRAGWPHVTTALCRMMGGTFVPLPEAPATPADLFVMLAALSKEASEATGELCRGLADGDMSASDAAKALREVDDVIRVAAAMRALLQSIQGGH